ncbi:hypothetical protein HELRODRAFT_192123 [Helobdella robusta]|uniref:YEATS domain-containing protein n=1 Tax=Helobdella robusta TaxID=6412 RepID=T1FTL5_HELRO|nr:hypothetical protein HELRODRAFT_192123 [Helobdella robusta]ESO03143.1 hypothetical protein HELRODRAFT_192123 [Helobdella robusta]
MKGTLGRSLPSTSKQECNACKNVQVYIEIGHKAWLRSPENQEPGKTHDWVLFVCGKDNQECNYVDKVGFRLHETFENPDRVVNEPPFEIRESGYGSFLATVIVHFKVREAPELHVASYYYDLTLPAEGQSPIGLSRCEKVTFKSVSMDFVELVLSGGGIIVSDEVADDALENQQPALPYYQENQIIPFESFLPNFPETTATKNKKSKKQNKSNNCTPTSDQIAIEKRQLEKNLFSQDIVKKSKSDSKPHKSAITSDHSKHSSESKVKKKFESSNFRSSNSPSHVSALDYSPPTVKQQSKKNKEKTASGPTGKASFQSYHKSSSVLKNSSSKRNEETPKKDNKHKSDLPSNKSFGLSTCKGSAIDKFQSSSNDESDEQTAENVQTSYKKSSLDKKKFLKKQIGSKSIATKPVSHLESAHLDSDAKESSSKSKRSSNESSASSGPVDHSIIYQSPRYSPQSDTSHFSALGDVQYVSYMGETTSGLPPQELMEIQDRIMNLKDDEEEGMIYLNIFRVFCNRKDFSEDEDIEFDLTKCDLRSINQIKRLLGM